MTAEQKLKAFGAAFDYDVNYLLEVSESSPGAFSAFSAAQPMSEYRDRLSVDAHFVARIVTMQTEDCGPCAQLNLQMAIQAGVERKLLETLLYNPEGLPSLLAAVRNHVLGVVGQGGVDLEKGDELRRMLGEAAFAELAICIAGSRIYPTLKRAMLAGQTCLKLDLKF